MDLQLTGKRAIVTGGSRGIGLAVADALAAEGADVGLVARDESALDAAVQGVGRHGSRAVALVADTGDDEAVLQMVDRAVELLGGVDILVNCAAAPATPGADPDLEGTSDDALRAELEIKVLGYLRCARAVAPHMVAQGWGRIVNISGLAARRSGSIIGSVRNISVVAMTGALADELGPKGVNVTVVHPGLTVTERLPGLVAGTAARQGVSEAEVEARLASSTTVGRLITAAEVADVVTFLASPRSIAINGDTIAAGGGSPGTTHY